MQGYHKYQGMYISVVVWGQTTSITLNRVTTIPNTQKYILVWYSNGLFVWILDTGAANDEFVFLVQISTILKLDFFVWYSNGHKQDGIQKSRNWSDQLNARQSSTINNSD